MKENLEYDEKCHSRQENEQRKKDIEFFNNTNWWESTPLINRVRSYVIQKERSTYKITKEELEKMYPCSRDLKDLPVSRRFSAFITNLINKCKVKGSE